MRRNEALHDDQATGGASPAERREHRRKAVLWGARIETRTGPTTDCIILDLSAGGAKLRGPAQVTAKQIVTLVIDRFGALRAEVVWARSGYLGLRFTDAPDQISHIIGATLPL